MNDFLNSKRNLIYFFLMAGGFLFLVLTNLGLYPTVFADEYIYSTLSRLTPLKASYFPIYLYLKLYSLANYCGDGFLSCGRIMNSGFFILSAPFIYKVSRMVANRGISTLVTFLAMAGPVNTYTAYFMPESMYFFGFWILCWSLLQLDFDSRIRYWAGAGVIYGATALVKPHSLFILPALLLYMAYIAYCAGSLFSRKLVYSAGAFVFAGALVKFAIGYLAAGLAGLTLFGPSYSSVATSAASNSARYVKLLKLAGISLEGHLLIVLLIYGLPAVMALVVVVNSFFAEHKEQLSEKRANIKFERIAFFALIVILNLVMVVALFTGSVANTSIYETPYRIHMRYYNFALPLFYIVAAGSIARVKATDRRVFRFVTGAVICLVAVYAICSNLDPYTPSLVDGPEFYGLRIRLHHFRLFGVFLPLSLLIWMFYEKIGARLYLYFALPLFVLVSYHNGIPAQRAQINESVYDRAGMFARHYLSKEDIAKTAVVGSYEIGLFRTLFALDNTGAFQKSLPEEAAVNLSDLPAGTKWLITVGDHPLPEHHYFQIVLNGYTLTRIGGEGVVDFRQSFWPGIVSRVSGLSVTEPWGTWSDSDSVKLEFTSPLPEKFELHLVASAFGSNADADLSAIVGSDVKKFRLSKIKETRVLRFDNPDNLNSIQFGIPKPTSPQELGQGSDDRKLGIAFIEMKIVPLDGSDNVNHKRLAQ